jgi:hypothetical protein
VQRKTNDGEEEAKKIRFVVDPADPCCLPTLSDARRTEEKEDARCLSPGGLKRFPLFYTVQLKTLIHTHTHPDFVKMYSAHPFSVPTLKWS